MHLDMAPFAPPPFKPASSRCPLGARLRRWICQEAREEVADCFFPWVRDVLQDLGCDLNRPASTDTFQQVQARLKREDITPARMERAFREAQRAREEGLSTLEWCRNLQQRAYSERVAQGAARRALVRLWADLEAEEFEKEKATLLAPPSPKETFAFLLAWKELGGSSALAAYRELQRRGTGAPPQN